jgi:hypothetical protein
MLRRPLGGSGYGFVRSIASLIPTQNLRHILSALQMLRICLFGPPKRHIQPGTLSAILCVYRASGRAIPHERSTLRSGMRPGKRGPCRSTQGDRATADKPPVCGQPSLAPPSPDGPRHVRGGDGLRGRRGFWFAGFAIRASQRLVLGWGVAQDAGRRPERRGGQGGRTPARRVWLRGRSRLAY